MEYINLILRSFFFYFLIILYLRVMGKREVGELSVFDLVLYFLMTELLAISISSVDESIWKTVLPVTTLALLQIALSWFLLKKKKYRDIIEGKPALLICNGKIMQEEMRRQRYTIDDLLYQIRDKDVGSVSEVEFAVLENSGVLSVLKKGQTPLLFPFPLISDGEIQVDMLYRCGLNQKWLLEKLRKMGYSDPRDIFICLWEKGGLHITLKEGVMKAQGMEKRRRKIATQQTNKQRVLVKDRDQKDQAK